VVTAVDSRRELRQIASGMLKVGDPAPDIDATGSDGVRFVLSAQKGLCTVIYFFPKAFTPGCTVETKRFRDNYAEIAMTGASIVGISTDEDMVILAVFRHEVRIQQHRDEVLVFLNERFRATRPTDAAPRSSGT
jgi:thioredoxin-dependent peroxiredoxin